MTQQSDLDLRRMNAVKAFHLGQESQGGGATMNFMDCLAPLLEANSKMFAQDEVECLDEIFAA